MFLVEHIVNNELFCRLSPDKREDLLQEGYLGLEKAFTLFKVESGYRFSTYAKQWARRYMIKALNADKDIKYPHYINTLIIEIFKLQNKAKTNLSEKELLATLKCPIQYLKHAMRALTPIRTEDDMFNVDMLENRASMSIERQVRNMEIDKILTEAFS